MSDFDFETHLTNTLKGAAINSSELGGLLPARQNWATNADMTAAYLPYNAVIHAFICQAIEAHMLILIHEADPALAAEIAEKVTRAGEMGDHSEMVWEWLHKRGVDPNAYVAEQATKRAVWLTQSYRGYDPDKPPATTTFTQADIDAAEKCGRAIGAANSARAYSQSPPEAIRQQREIAWDEGYTSGHSNAMRRMSDEPDAPTTPNPYRQPKEHDHGN